MRELIDHLNAALVIADDLSQTLLGALLSECVEHARQVLGASTTGRG